MLWSFENDVQLCTWQDHAGTRLVHHALRCGACQHVPIVCFGRVQAWDVSGRMGPAPTLYRGPGDVVRTILQKEGGVPGLTTGLKSCLIRDAVGCGAMFAVYEGIKGVMAQHQVRARLPL
jgi:hypothetical protein